MIKIYLKCNLIFKILNKLKVKNNNIKIKLKKNFNKKVIKSLILQMIQEI